MEEKQSKVTFEFYSPDNDWDLQVIYRRASIMGAMREVDDYCRGLLKYGKANSDDLGGEAYHIVEVIREMICESGFHEIEG